MASENSRSSLSVSSRVCTSLPDSFDLVSSSTRTKEVFNSIVKGRKSWKTLRGGEIVWPPELEAALLEGLESYQPDDSRETRMLGRFPMRNRFISDYIFHKTGTRRTAKQVGSRLQQLRDTCAGKKLMKLLSPLGTAGPSRYNHPSRRFSNDTDSSSDLSSPPSTPLHTHSRFDDATRTVISIDILPTDGSCAYEPAEIFSVEDLEWDRSNGIVRPSPQARPFHTIDPTVTFVATSAMSAQSHFTVHSAGTVVFEEKTRLAAAGKAPHRTDDALLYSTTLVPGFWKKIGDSPDPTQYTINQDVIQSTQNVPSIIFSAVYKFTYPSRTPQVFNPSSASPFHEEKLMCEAQESLTMDCLLAMDVFPNFPETGSYFVFDDNSSPWDARSPSALPSEISGYPGSDDEVDPTLSPVSVCYSLDFSNYASSLLLSDDPDADLTTGIMNPSRQPLARVKLRIVVLHRFRFHISSH
ncbi:hypothetical protein H0H81_002190 [Sphagnurus paluster]|uniref:TEA domain-containing protein n=1 Tax=Sphagnurus paluster TaxID=117069 RepID=A0A9P7GN26_9AGAR|nr:hypothetical protein H0H81_002190 [Sphagnurus paluster]